MLIQGLDFLYLFVYPAWLSLAAARLGLRLGGGRLCVSLLCLKWMKRLAKGVGAIRRKP
jgi:hypothetical protein